MKRSTSIKLWRYFTLLVFCYCISPTSQLSLIPPTPNITAKTINRMRQCKIKKCQIKWIEAGDEKIFNARKCTGDGKPDNKMEKILNNSLHLISKSRVLLDRRYWAELNCNSCDRFFVPISQYIREVYIHVWNKWYEFQNCHKFFQVKYDPNRCPKFLPGMAFIRQLFCITFTPLTIVLSAINVSVLRQMLKNEVGACLYYHMFELFTDLLTTLAYIFGEQGFYWFQHLQLHVCGMIHMLIPVQTGWTLLEMLQWCNQMFVTLLIRDRCAALSHPLQYNAIPNHKKIASKSFFMVIFGTVIYYMPFILNFNFRPVKMHIAKQLGWWDTRFTDRLFITFYSLAYVVLILLQIHYSLKSHRLYKQIFARGNRWASGAAEKLKQKKGAKAKKQLLIGTVFLNIFVQMVCGLSLLFNNNEVGKALTDLIGEEAHKYTKSVINTLRMLAFFANSTLCVLLHIFTCKSYRIAFRSTLLGRLLCKSASVGPSTTQ